jgi:Fe-S-cluster containining protein
VSDKDATPAPQDPHEQLQEKILEEYQRMGPDDAFEFSCRPGISCFNNCCGDVNIFLSPYDVLRLKRRLGITSGEFLEKYALMPVHKEMKTPVVMLRMNDDDAKSCPLLTDEGCGVYSDRPWPCRMYPLGMAAQKDTPDGWRGDRFYFLLQEKGCHGFEEQPRKWTVRQWLDDQGVEQQEEWGEQWKQLTLHKFFEDGGILSPERMQMMFTACYDLDKFREFIFGSTLLQRFELDEDYVEEIRYNDEALLGFAYQWLRFSLFGEPTMKAKPEVVEAFKGKLDKKKVFDKDQAKT